MVWLMPILRVMSRVDQWVAPTGCSVSVIIRSTASPPTSRGAPLRGASTGPSSRCATKRCRQVIAFWRLTPDAQ